MNSSSLVRQSWTPLTIKHCVFPPSTGCLLQVFAFYKPSSIPIYTSSGYSQNCLTVLCPGSIHLLQVFQAFQSILARGYRAEAKSFTALSPNAPSTGLALRFLQAYLLQVFSSEHFQSILARGYTGRCRCQRTINEETKAATSISNPSPNQRRNQSKS